MNAKTIIIVGIIAVALGILYLSIKPPANDLGQNYVTDPATGDELNPQDLFNQDSGEVDLLLDSPEFKKATTSGDCDAQSGTFREECYSNLALIKNDFSYCNSISQQNYYLNDSCFYQIALKQKNADLCLQMNDGIIDCLTEVALATKDSGVCEMAGFEKDLCLKALRENNADLCKKLGVNRASCSDAIDNKDATYCNNIYNAADACFEQLAIQEKKPEFCAKISSNSDSCYYKIALSTNNANLCELLKENRDKCIAWVAFNTNDKTLCEQAGTERQSCLEDLA